MSAIRVWHPFSYTFDQCAKTMIGWSPRFFQDYLHLIAVLESCPQCWDLTRCLPQLSLVVGASQKLFSNYTNGLPQHLKCEPVTYADDAQLLSTYRFAEQDLGNLAVQVDLVSIEHWMEKNHLAIYAKIQVIILVQSRSQLTLRSHICTYQVIDSVILSWADPQQLHLLKVVLSSSK